VNAEGQRRDHDAIRLAVVMLAGSACKRRSCLAQDSLPARPLTLVVGYQAGSLYERQRALCGAPSRPLHSRKSTVIRAQHAGAGTLTAANNVANLAPQGRHHDRVSLLVNVH